VFARLASVLAPRLHRFRWLVLAVWLVLVGAGIANMGGLNRLMSEDAGARTSSSWRANAILREKFQHNALTEMAVIYESAGAAPAAVAAYRARLIDLVGRVPGVTATRPLPVPDTAPGLGLDYVRLDSQLEDEAAVRVAKAVQSCLAANPPPAGLKASLMGRPVIMGDLTALNDREVVRIERVSLVITLGVLLLVFGSLVSALLPVAMGLVSITVTLGVLTLLGGWVPVVSLTRLITSVMAIALGIDYALFIVSRYREERDAGRAPTEAVRETLTHTGEAIVFSGLIMIVSVGALAIPDFSATRAIAGAVALVVAVSVLASLTLLPALLLLTDRALKTPPWLARVRWGHGEATWRRLSRSVVRRHRPILAATAIAVALLMIPLFQLRVWEPGPTLMPRELTARQAYDALTRAGLSGELDAFYVTFHQAPGGPTLAPSTLAAMDDAARRLMADPRIARVDSLVTARPGWTLPRYQALYAQLDNPIARFALMPRLETALRQDAGGTYTVMRVVPRVGLTSPAARELAIDLKAHVLPNVALPAGVRMDLGGNVPRRVDFTTEVYRHFPAIVLTVVGAVYVLLLLYFRSLLLPLKAVLMNAIPVLGATAVLALVMQHGIGAGLLGIDEPPGAILAMTPLMVFCLIFGLSMDYEVLILSRIQEAHRRGMGDDEAIVEGMTRTSGIITGAALIMLSVFAPNMASALVNAKELGLALSTAVLLDATVVRLLLVPTAMRAMGRWNWYFPGRQHTPRNDQAA
jgi:RND superfamily putative drug exporter